MSGAVLALMGAADGPDAPLTWALVDPKTGAVNERGVGARPPATPSARTVLVLPGMEGQLKRIQIPARTEAQARAGAVHFFGALATSDSAHYAVGSTMTAAGDRLVTAIEPQRLERWLAAARALGCDPGVVALDCAVWPAPHGGVAVVALPDRTVVSAGEEGGFSLEEGLARTVAPRWAAQLPVPPSVMALHGADPEAWGGVFGPGVRVARAADPDPVADLARAAALLSPIAPNLRQGAFALGPAQGPSWRAWRFAAALAALAVLLQAGTLALAGYRDLQAAARLTAQAERDFRAKRPDVRRIVNLRAQAAGLLNAQSQASAHPVLAAASPLARALQAHPETRLDALRHQGPGRTVILTVSAPRRDALETFVNDLGRHGLRAAPGDLQLQSARAVMELALETP